MLSDFLSPEEVERIEKAIEEAERVTSGEIRIHITSKQDYDEILLAAVDKFAELGMDNTQERNGVLIFICPVRKEFAIIGDEGINRVVGQDFWDATRDVMLAEFKKGRFADGIIRGVKQAGESLAKFFPGKKSGVNELPNHISYD
ncbi:MAG: TPM domain-containing protein [Thermaurantimonas sp.]|uniref:TPM domain-containing protein n=1 Tax=Thermaurantimonas sp. TaxID=2681568 RepID=UPI003918A09F